MRRRVTIKKMTMKTVIATMIMRIVNFPTFLR